MKKQYIAEYQHNLYDIGQWKNAGFFAFGKRYLGTLEAAEAAILKMKKTFDGNPSVRHDRCGDFSIRTETDRKTANDMMITKTRIRVREVTEWETVSEE